MFKLIISTVLTDGSENETTLTWESCLLFETIHQDTTLMVAVDENISTKYLTTLAWLAHKQIGPVGPLETFGKQIQAVGYRVERVPFGEAVSTESPQL
jgi:hypothetical protein